MKKFLLLFFTIFLIIAFNSCQLDSEEKKTTWEKYEPKALSSITFICSPTFSLVVRLSGLQFSQALPQRFC